jgi:hypothetical protein
LFEIGSHLDELGIIGKMWESDCKGVFEIGVNCSLKLLGKSVPIIHMSVGVLALSKCVQEHVFNE